MIFLNDRNKRVAEMVIEINQSSKQFEEKSKLFIDLKLNNIFCIYLKYNVCTSKIQTYSSLILIGIVMNNKIYRYLYSAIDN